MSSVLYNPYKNIDWNIVNRTVSVTHAHGRTRTTFNRLYNAGVRHMAISNYHPSEPLYPINNYLQDLPMDIIQCPNAEYYHMGLERYSSVRSNMHWCAPGFTRNFRATSGLEWPDSSTASSSDGYECYWMTAINDLANYRLYEDAGIVTINHPGFPYRHYLQAKKIIELLDYTDLFGGIEIYNDSCYIVTNDTDPNNSWGWNVDTWDSVLMYGRKCYCFMVSDHAANQSPRMTNNDWLGRNILLTNNTADEHNTLIAYKNGEFYTRLSKSEDLKFTEISLSNNDTLSVTTENADTINIVVDGSIVKSSSNNTISYQVPTGSIYARIEANNQNDSIYSNPFMFKMNIPIKVNNKNKDDIRKYFYFF